MIFRKNRGHDEKMKCLCLRMISVISATAYLVALETIYAIAPVDAASFWYPAHTDLSTSSSKTIETTFVDSNDGFRLIHIGSAMGSEAIEIDRTRNGGEGWQRVVEITNHAPFQNGLTFGHLKTGIGFLNPSTGWLTGYEDTYDRPPFLYVTHDAGRTWSLQKLKIPYGKVSSVLYPPVFFSPKLGLLPAKFYGTFSLYTIYFTRDGGRSWELKNKSSGSTAGLTWSMSSTSDPLHPLFSVTYRGAKWVCRDGITWTKKH
jgi:photosystem II stability/assembly factor-like uncharacterized protein